MCVCVCVCELVTSCGKLQRLKFGRAQCEVEKAPNASIPVSEVGALAILAIAGHREFDLVMSRPDPCTVFLDQSLRTKRCLRSCLWGPQGICTPWLWLYP